MIIGGGPAGCSCGLYTARASLKTAILDKNSAVGALAITHKIANYPGVAGDVSGEALLAVMRQQAVDFGAVYQRSQVYGLDLSGEVKQVYTPEGIFRGRALVLATGAMGRKASFRGEAEFLGRGVSYCATCDGAFYRDRAVAVIGNNSEAMEEAQVLIKFANTVHWVTFKEVLAEDEHAQSLLSHPAVKHWPRSRLLAIVGNDSGVNGIEVRTKTAKDSAALPVDGVFIYQNGSKPITDFIGDQVVYNADGGVQVDAMMATSAKGGRWAIFAIPPLSRQ